MKWLNSGIKTLRQAPSDAALPGHALLVQGGYFKKLSAGLFSYGPLLVRAVNKFESLVREELNRQGCAEILMPMVQPQEIWEQSGRWSLYDELLQKITSRTGRKFCLGPTHEEAVSEYIKRDIQSYKDLPLCVYQIQTKFRDEIRPRFGLLRAKEFIMKDAYSFDCDETAAQKSYQKMRGVYQKIFSRAGLPFYIVKADSGEIGGPLSEEFHIPAKHGEEELLTAGDYAVSKSLNPDIKAGDQAPNGKVFSSCRGIEVGHIFCLGDQYSKSMSIVYKNSNGETKHVQMGCYGIGITRTVQAVVEHSHDEYGIVWPFSMAPFLVHICLLDPGCKNTYETACSLYTSLKEKGVDVFLDDRNEKPGVKFKDADLLGLPLRINIGQRDLKSDCVELVQRRLRTKQKLSVSGALQGVLDKLAEHKVILKR